MPTWETICLKCLEKEPAARYGSAEALAEDLEAWLKHEPIRARPSTWINRAMKWTRRDPVMASLALVSSVAALALAGVAFGLAYNGRLRAALDRAADAEKQARKALAEADDAKAKEEGLRKQTQSALGAAQWAHYLQRLTWAERDWLANQTISAEVLLDESPTELRGWEWRYLKQLCHSELADLKRADLLAIGFTDGGQRLCAAGKNSVFPVTSWEVVTNGSSLLFARKDGPPLQTVSTDGELIPAFSAVLTGCLINSDGTRLAAVFSDGMIGLWQLPDQQFIWRRWDRPVARQASLLGLSGDSSRMLAYYGGTEVKDWKADNSKPLRLPSGIGNVLGIALNGNGSRIAIAAGSVYVYDGGSKELGWSSNEPGQGALSVAFSPDEETLASGHGDGTLQLWAVETGERQFTLRAHDGPVYALAFSPVKGYLASAGADRLVRARRSLHRFARWPAHAGE
jgi:hypothetical protein